MSDVGEVVPSGVVVSPDGVTEMLLISSYRVDVLVGGEVEPAGAKGVPDGSGSAPDGEVVTPEASTCWDELSFGA